MPMPAFRRGGTENLTEPLPGMPERESKPTLTPSLGETNWPLSWRLTLGLNFLQCHASMKGCRSLRLRARIGGHRA